MGEREEGREGQWERRREGERSNMYILVYIQYCIQYVTYIICSLASKESLCEYLLYRWPILIFSRMCTQVNFN